MYDLQRVGKIFADIEKYFKEMESYNLKGEQDLKDSKNYNATSMLLLAILNKIIELGGEVLAEEKAGAPGRYQDIMPMLAKANILNKDAAERLNKLIKQRNILAHYYGEMTEKGLFKLTKDIYEIKDFMRAIKKRMGL
jgi:uncharacterized protein YutE (UPF0331/DUF86 family)